MTKYEIIDKGFKKYLLTNNRKSFACVKIVDDNYILAGSKMYKPTKEDQEFLVDFLISEGMADRLREECEESKQRIEKQLSNLQRELELANIGLNRLRNNEVQKTLI